MLFFLDKGKYAGVSFLYSVSSFLVFVMIYFSEVFGNKVFDTYNHQIGSLRDFYFVPIETPVITKFVVKTKDKQTLNLPIQLLKKKGKDFYIDSATFESEPIKDNEVSILQNIQDQQIMDIKGAKIIRANDVIIQDTPRYTVSGIDIGIFGVFRWIKLAKFLADMVRRFDIQYKSEFLPWSDIQPLEVAKGKIVLKQEKEKMSRLQPEDLADYLEHSNTLNVLKVLRLLDPEHAVNVIADINSSAQTKLINRFSPDRAAQIIALIDPDEAVDILLSLSEIKRNEILEKLTGPKKKEILHLLKHARTPIGHLMTSQFLLVSSDITVRKAIDSIRKDTKDFSEVLYLYIKNSTGQLIGVLDIHELMMENLDDPLYKIMHQNIVVVRLTTPKEIAVQKMLKYHLYSLPVIDENRIMLGIVSLDNASEEFIKQALNSTI